LCANTDGFTNELDVSDNHYVRGVVGDVSWMKRSYSTPGPVST